MESEALERLPCALCRWDTAGDLVEATSWLAVLTGCGLRDLLAHRVRIRDLILPADREARAAVLRRSAQTDKPYEVEYRIRLSGGDVRWVQERGQHTAGGRVGMLLEPSSELLRGQVAALQQALVQIATHPAMVSGDLPALCAVITESAARLLQVERASIWLLDASRRHLEQVDLFVLSTATHSRGVVLLAEEYPVYFAAIQSGRVIDAHDARLDPRTREFRAQYLEPQGIHALLDAAIRVGGEVVGVLCLEATLAVRHWLPLEMTFVGELTEQVGHGLQRHAQVRNQQAQEALQQALQQAQRMEAIGRLAGGVAHDFNNLLTVIVHATERLSAPAPALPAQHDALRMLDASTRRATRLIEQLLTFSRQQAAPPAPLDPVSVIRDMEALLVQLLGPTVALRLELSGASCGVAVAPVHLEQVLMNLAINARHAMPDGGQVVVRGSVRPVAGGAVPTLAAGRYFCLEVEDTGPGVPPSLRERVFEPFFTTRSAERGSGLGLSTVYGLVRQAGGEVLVQDAAPHGARLVVYLPAVAVGDGSGAEAVVAAAAAVSVPAAGRLALLVEEDAPIRHIVARFLRLEGFEVVGVEGVAAGQQWLDGAGRLDLLLSRAVLCDGPGPVLGVRVRARFPGARVVYMADDVDRVALSAEQAAGAGVLPRPFRLEQLLQLVRPAG